MTVDVDHIREVISRVHNFRQWIVLDEFPLEGDRRTTGTPKIDVLAIKTLDGGRCLPHTREAYEIKTNRRDFQFELRHPEKRQRAFAICDHYWFAVPERLVEEEEVPPDCGLMWVSRSFSAPIVIKSAPKLDTNPPSMDFMMDVARRAYQIGRRDGASTCAFERFDMLANLAHMLVANDAQSGERRAALSSIAKALRTMQRHKEARELMRIAAGSEPSSSWFVPKTLQSGRVKAGRRKRPVR